MNKYTLSIVTVFTFFVFKVNAQADLNSGKRLFNSNCAACHRIDKKLVGPAMSESVQKRTYAWFKSFVINNAALRASGDKDAIETYNKYSKMVMPSYTQFSDKDVSNIYEYIKANIKK